MRWRGRLRSHRSINAALGAHLLIIHHVHRGNTTHPVRGSQHAHTAMYEVSAQHDDSCSRMQFNASAQNTPAISSSPCFHLFPMPDHSRVPFDNVTAQCIFLCATRRMVVAHTGKCSNNDQTSNQSSKPNTSDCSSLFLHAATRLAVFISDSTIAISPAQC